MKPLAGSNKPLAGSNLYLLFRRRKKSKYQCRMFQTPNRTEIDQEPQEPKPNMNRTGRIANTRNRNRTEPNRNHTVFIIYIYLPTYLPARLPACLPTYLPTYLCTHARTHVHTYTIIHIHTYLTLPYLTIPYHNIPYHTILYYTIPYHTIPYIHSYIHTSIPLRTHVRIYVCVCVNIYIYIYTYAYQELRNRYCFPMHTFLRKPTVSELPKQ